MYPYVHCKIIYNRHDIETTLPCPPMNEYIKKMYTMEYYSALESKEILTFATTWIDFDGIMLSEILVSQTDKYKHCTI